MNPPTTLDEKFMRRALELAALAAGTTRPNPAVGAVIVRDGRIIGEGHTAPGGRPHAETEAIRLATESTHGATMYVTLEPCNHTGRTGPCSEAVIAAGIARVVIAARDPNIAARGGVERLRDAGIEVETGLLPSEAKQINPAFHTFHELGRPLVTLKWAMTLDGATSTSTGDSKWITDEAARHRAHELRAAHDAVVAGIETVLADRARLTTRGVALPGGIALRRIVLDSSLRLPLDAPFLEPASGSKPIVVCCEDASSERAAALESAGAEIWRLRRGKDGRVSLADFVLRCRGEGIASIMVEGGRTLAGSFLEHNLADRVAAFVAPKVLGGGTMNLGPLQRSTSPTQIAQSLELHNMSVSAAGSGFLIEGWLSRHLFE